MRIALSGTHCSGKSTTVKRAGEMLNKRGIKFVITENIARDVLGNELIMKPDSAQQEKILHQMMQLHDTLLSFLSPRTVVDALAYYLCFGYDIPSWINYAKIKSMYDIVFLIDGYFEPDDSYSDWFRQNQEHVLNVIKTLWDVIQPNYSVIKVPVAKIDLLAEVIAKMVEIRYSRIKRTERRENNGEHSG